MTQPSFSTALLCATAILAFAAAGPANSQAPLVPVTLTTGFVFTGGSAAPLMMADDRGYFEQGGVKINIVRGFGSADVIAKVASGTYQAGTGYLPELVRAKAANPDLDAIAIVISYDASPDAVTALKKSGITRPGDVASHRIVAQPNSTAMITFPLFAKAVGIDPSSVKWIEISPELWYTTVHRGDADLVAGFGGGAVSNFARLGYKPDEIIQYYYSDYQPNLYGNALIVMKSWAEKNPEAVKGLVRAYIRGLIEARKEPSEAIKSLLTREPLLKGPAEQADLEFTSGKFYFTRDVMQKGVAYHTEEDVKRFIDSLVGPFGLKRTPAVSEIYSAAYLPPIAERMVK
jgi:NitT/TauT family transport system substrate-binding protein